jgi:AcrR family transcriptional regulator
MHQVLRERLLDAASELISTQGWDALGMTQVARMVGVSRQAAYKQFSGKAALGEAVVTRETDRVLAGVTSRLRACGADPVAGITAAAGYVLRAAATSPLVKALLTDGRGGAPGLLPLVTTRPEPVLARAIAAVATEAQHCYGTLRIDSQTISRLSEIIVRLTLSHLVQPTGPVDEALAQIRLLIENALATLT